LTTTLYRGSAKNILGPVRVDGIATESIVFEFTDQYSIFDWGQMPNPIPGKGSALALTASALFEKLAEPSCWEELSKSKLALEFRKSAANLESTTRRNESSSVGSAINELGEKLKTNAQATHYLGIAENTDNLESPIKPKALGEVSNPFNRILVAPFAVKKPKAGNVLGKPIYDYSEYQGESGAKLIPLEFVFRFSFPKGSSFPSRVKSNSLYFEQVPLALDSGVEFQSGTEMSFPVLECSTKFETTDRPVTLSEAVLISGLSTERFEELLIRTAWCGLFLKHEFSKMGIELADGKIEWGVSDSGEFVLLDSVGPDEVRILIDGTQVSKEILRADYRDSDWYRAVVAAKEQIFKSGDLNWKKSVTLAPEKLSSNRLRLVGDMYQSLANGISGKEIFGNLSELKSIAAEIAEGSNE